MLTGVFVKNDGFVPAGQAVSAGGGADHVRTIADQPEQDEGNQKDLQVRYSFAVEVFSSKIIYGAGKWVIDIINIVFV